MSGLYGTFKTNPEQEREGRWFYLAGVKNEDGTEPGFKLARMSKANPQYQAAIERVAKELRQAIELDTLTEDVADPVMKQVFIETILLDWQDVQDKDNSPLPFTKDNAAKLFADLPDLYFILIAEAQKLSNFRGKEIEAVAKKSSRQSGRPSGQTDT